MPRAHVPEKVHLRPALPHHVIFAITYRCDARCSHCSIGADYESIRSTELPLDGLLKTIDDIADMQVHFLALSGGEALLHPDFFTVLDYCKAKGLLVAVATNGGTLTIGLVEGLKQHGIDGVLVSLDHPEPPVHDGFRNYPGLFEKAVAGMRNLVASGIPTTLGVTAMRLNYGRLGDLVELALNLGLVGVNLSTLIPTGRATRNLDLTPDEWSRVISEWITMGEQLKGQIRLSVHEPRIYAIRPDLPGLECGLSGCLAGYTHCYVLPDGNVTSCVMLPTAIGNICEKPLRQILYDYQAGRNFFDRSLLKGRCASCQFRYRCGGCRAVALSYTGDAFAPDPRCWIGRGRVREEAVGHDGTVSD